MLKNKKTKKETRKTITFNVFLLSTILSLLASGAFGNIKQETTEDGIHIINKEEVTLHIAPALVDCYGMVPQKCMVVNGSFFYRGIEGFNFEEGTEYELLAERIDLSTENLPQDGSSSRWRLLETIKETKISTTEDVQNTENNNQPNPSTQAPTTSTPPTPPKQETQTPPKTPSISIPVLPPQQEIQAPPKTQILPPPPTQRIPQEETPPPSTSLPKPHILISPTPQEEASPSYTLENTSWILQEITLGNNQIEIPPKERVRFRVNFSETGFGSSTDCNTVSGNYSTSEEDKIKINILISTRAYCSNSKEREYTRALSEATNYEIKNNILILTSETSQGLRVVFSK